MVALRTPAAVGLKVTFAVHLALGARGDDETQLSVSAKSPAFVPPIATPVTVSDPVPVFCKLMPCAELVLPTVRLANVRLEGESVAVEAMPVPVRPMLCGLPAALSVKFNAAFSAPDTLGVNFALTEHMAVGATVAPVQVSALVAKSAALVPPTATVLIVRLALPLFVIVTLIAALVVPI